MISKLYFPDVSGIWLYAVLILSLLILLMLYLKVTRDSNVAMICSTGLYIIILLIVTIFSRHVKEECQIVFEPFWSYKSLLSSGFSWLFWQIAYNIVMMIPLGFLLSVMLKSYIKNKGVILSFSVVFGFITSLSVEFMQFLLKRGTSELDDVINNILGTVIGVLIYFAVDFVKIQLKREENLNDT